MSPTPLSNNEIEDIARHFMMIGAGLKRVESKISRDNQDLEPLRIAVEKTIEAFQDSRDQLEEYANITYKR